jgi:hypothetical protein
MAAPSSACRNSVSFDSGPQAARVDGPRVISKNLAIVQERGLVETNSATALESAKQKQTRLLVLNLDEMPANQIASQIQAIVDDLNKVQPGTTSYAESRELLNFANQKLAQLAAQ